MFMLLVFSCEDEMYPLKCLTHSSIAVKVSERFSTCKLTSAFLIFFFSEEFSDGSAGASITARSSICVSIIPSAKEFSARKEDFAMASIGFCTKEFSITGISGKPVFLLFATITAPIETAVNVIANIFFILLLSINKLLD